MQQPMFARPAALVINVTLRCPLRCHHCCYSSDMFQGGHLSLDDVLAAIDQAGQVDGIHAVHFVGGDPFLHPELLEPGIRRASANGLETGITTSAYWAKSPQSALEALQPLRDAGLTELTISYDDAHAAFVKPHFIVNAVIAAREAGVRLRVAVVVEPGCAIRADGLAHALREAGCGDVDVYETAMNATGRAAESQPADDPGDEAPPYVGPCGSVMRNIQVSPTGAIFPCCGVLPHHASMQVGTLEPGGLQRAVDKVAADPLYRWIAAEGPIRILQDMAAPGAGPDRQEQARGICAACDKIFSNPVLLTRARRHAAARRQPD